MKISPLNSNPAILNAKTLRFLAFGEELGGALPLRRILSLARIHKVKTVVLEKHVPNVDTDNDCTATTSIYPQPFERPCISCRNYITYMNEVGAQHGQKLLEKKCYMLHFLSTPYDKIREKDVQQRDLLGYCIVHIDKIKFDDKERIVTYIPECIFSRKIKAQKNELHQYGDFSTSINVLGSRIKIRGNYYSQQNGTTNCCSQAAIKMALRGFFPEITCEAINKTFLAPKPLVTKTGADGMTIEEMRKAITAVSNGYLDTFTIIADKPCGYEFVKNIYHAIESKIPVILILTTPSPEGMLYKDLSHAIAVIGHTFHSHGWSAYGGMYFFKDPGEYLSSFHWCDNFVVQDDNFGPLYQIPPRLLIDIIDNNSRTSAFKYSAMARHKLNEDCQDVRVAALCVYPKKQPWIQSITTVEHVAAHLLYNHINKLSKEGLLPKESNFHTYFYKIAKKAFHLNDNDSKFKPESFIFRTILSRKKDYLTKDIVKLFTDSGVINSIKQILPKYFWVIEISISELFWVNKAKVGEIIIDPCLFYKQIQDGRKADFTICPFIRIPYMLTINSLDSDNDDIINASISLIQESPHQELILSRRSPLRDIPNSKTYNGSPHD